MIQENPAEVSAQVIFGKYVELSGLVFTGETIQEMIDRDLPRVLGNSWIDRKVMEEAYGRHGPDRLGESEKGGWNNRFAIGVDFARQTDFTVISVLDLAPYKASRDPARLVYFKRLNRVPWDSIYAEVGWARAHFGDNILCDGTGPGGDVVMDALDSRNYCPVHNLTVDMGAVCMRHGRPLGCNPRCYLALNCCDDYDFNGNRKKELVEHFRTILSVGYDPRESDVSFGLIRTPPIVQLEEELSFYAWDDKKLMTDCLFSLCLATWAAFEDYVGESSYGGVF